MKKETGTVINQCLRHIRDIKKTDPLRSITCIVPSNGYIRTIKKAIHQSGEAVAGLSISTMRSFIIHTTENELLISGKRYIDAMDIHSIFREILKSKKLIWSDKVKEFSVMPDILSSSILNLILNSSITNHDDCFTALGDKGRDLSVIYKEYCKIKKTSSLADYSDLVLLCKKVIENSPDISDSSFIIFPYIENDISFMENECLKLLSEKSVITIPDEEVNTTAAVDFFTAPYDTLEISVISERILSLVKQSGTHFEDIAVVCPYDYLALAASEFDAAGIPYFSQYGIPDSKSGASSIIDALFSFIKSDMNFQDIKKFLLLCRHVSWIDGNSSDDKDHFKITSSGLLNNARKFGAAEGYDNWIHNLTIAIDEENKSDSPKAYFLSHLNALKTMITDIGEYKDWHKTELDSARHADIASALINKFISSGLERNRILTVTDRTGKPAIPVVMTGSDFMEMFLSLISSFCTPAGSAEGSIYLTTKIDDGIFDHVFAPGMTEQRIPKKIRQDPVLSDIDIKKIREIPGYHLLTAGEKNAIESAKSKRFIGSAYKSWTGSAPSMDILDGKRLYPTPLIMWIYEKSSATEGVKEFLKQRGFRSFILPVKDEKALNPAEFETARIIFDKTKTSATHYFASNEAAYGTYMIEKILWSGDEFNDYTGMTGINELKSGLTMSATHAVNLVQCPYKFFLNKCVQLRKIEEPVPAEDIDVMNTGTLVHEILEKFMLIVRDKKPKHDKYESLLKETMDKVLSEFLETNELRYSVIWNKRKIELESYLQNFLDFEIKNENSTIEIERAFGRDGEPPVSIELGRFKGEFSGKIDRIDKTADGYSIIDYKTSFAGKYKKGFLDGGSRIQPFIYAEAYKKIIDRMDAKIKAGFLPVKEAGNPILYEYTDDLKEKMVHIFNYMHDLLETGSFFPTGVCTYCDYSSICSTRIGMHIEKKIGKTTGVLNDYHTIKDYE